MPRTSPKVQFGLYAIELKQASTPSSTSDLQPFSKVEDLKTGNVTVLPYATWEPDFWLLDGRYKFLPADNDIIHVGLMSLDMSDSAGDFSTPIVLTIDFGQDYTTDGVQFRFGTYSGDFCTEMDLVWKDREGGTILSATYYPDDTQFSISQSVVDFQQLVITFKSTNRAYRYLRVTGLDFGELVTFQGTDIKEASVIEELDQLSSQLRIDTLSLKLFSSDLAFNMLNPTGYYSVFAERQPLAVYETVDNMDVFIGQFFLDTWQNTSDTELEFYATDFIGLMDSMTYRGNLWEEPGTNLETVLEELLGTVNIPYELDATLYGTKIVGWLPVSTVREALQQIAFAVGASVSCARSWAVKIYTTKIARDTTPTYTITRDQKGAEQALRMKPQVAGVEVTGHNYRESATVRTLFDGTLAVGVHELRFSEPYFDFVLTGTGSITESGPNYVIITVATAGAHSLTGKEYKDITQRLRMDNPDVSGAVRPIMEIDTATLVWWGNMTATTQRVYNYVTQRHLQKAKLYAPTIQVGDAVYIDTLYDSQIKAVIEKMETDLTGGMVSKIEATGVYYDPLA